MIFFELSQQIYRFRVKSDFLRYDNWVIVSGYRFRVIVTVKSGLIRFGVGFEKNIFEYFFRSIRWF